MPKHEGITVKDLIEKLQTFNPNAIVYTKGSVHCFLLEEKDVIEDSRPDVPARIFIG